MKQMILWALAVYLWLPASQSATIATIKTTVGTIELELYDEDKPITVSNFIKYAQSGRYSNTFLHRWITNFVFQGGGFLVTNTPMGQQIAAVQTDPPIFNEYSVGRKFSNTYGTIAMARSGAVNSATSQWFINLKDNGFLDLDNGGFTVFGRVISGTNVVNLFIPPSGTQGIYSFRLDNGVFTDLPVLTNSNPGYDDLIYTAVSLRRDVGLKVNTGRFGKTLTWNSVSGVTNILEFSTNALHWTTLTNLPGLPGQSAVVDGGNSSKRFYRVRLGY